MRTTEPIRRIAAHWLTPRTKQPAHQDRRCSVAGCGRPYRSKGLCVMHYTRVQQHGWDSPEQKRVW
jgi:hypothetical protein